MTPVTVSNGAATCIFAVDTCEMSWDITGANSTGSGDGAISAVAVCVVVVDEFEEFDDEDLSVLVEYVEDDFVFELGEVIGDDGELATGEDDVNREQQAIFLIAFGFIGAWAVMPWS